MVVTIEDADEMVSVTWGWFLAAALATRARVEIALGDAQKFQPPSQWTSGITTVVE